MKPSDDELGGASAELDGGRVREAQLRREAEAVAAGLRALNEADSPEDRVTELLGALCTILGVAVAGVCRTDGTGDPVVVAATEPDLEGRTLPVRTELERARRGRPVSELDVAEAPGLRAFAELGSSLLLRPLALSDFDASLFLLHGSRGFFTPAHVGLSRAVAPLVELAIRTGSHREAGTTARVARIARFPEENPRPVVRCSEVGQVLYANPSARRLLDEVSTPEDLPEAWAQWIHRALEGGALFDVEADALGCVWSVAVVPVASEGYVNLYFTDITERRAAQAELMRSNVRLSALVSQQRTAVLLEDERRRVVLTNQAFCDLFEIPVPPDVLVGADCAAAAQQTSTFFDDPQTFITDIDEILRLGSPTMGELLRLADGRALERDYVPIRVQGVPGGHLWLYRDLTEQHRVQRRLRDAKRDAERANQAKSEFLARISHEIRTPLNSMMGMTELALESVLNEEQRSWLRVAHANSTAMSLLINDILDLSRIEDGGIELRPDSVEPARLAADVLDGFAGHAAARGVELYLDVESTAPAAVMADGDRLRQVLANLVGNAVKYTDEGEVGVVIEVTHGGLRFAVCDTGTGIPEGELERIFERYTQVSYGARPGTGLGLTIARQLTDLMGGKLTVSSALGEGSRFDLELPVLMLRGEEPFPEEQRRALVGLRVAAVAPPTTLSRLRRMIAGTGSIVVDHDLDDLHHLDDVDVLVVDERVPRAVEIAGASSVPVVRLLSVTSTWRLPSAPDRSTRLFKPVRRSSLVAALYTAARGGHTAGAATTGSAALPTRVAPPLCVLVVDDSADNRAVAAAFLDRAGHRFTLAASATEALALAVDGDFDVVLMDLHMAGQDGLDATRQLHALRHGAGRSPVPVVALTAHVTAGMRAKAAEAGMVGFVAKPVSRAGLVAAVERAAGWRRRVLIVDDAPHMQRLLRHYLRTVDLDVVEASDGAEALRMVEVHRPDAVLMDVEMPRMSGKTAVLRLRECGWSGPALALTGFASPSARQALLKAGFNAVLTKPVQREALLLAVQEAFY